ncbi:MAG: response regulator transcription factor [Dehalococcoidia bacterium]
MITLLLIDDQPSVRQGLRMRLELEPDVAIVGEAGDGAAAVDLARQLHPDVVLMDVKMPVMDGIAAADAIRALDPHPAVVMLTLHDDVVTRRRCQAAGAAAFVSKHEAHQSLIPAIRRVAGAA